MQIAGSTDGQLLPVKHSCVKWGKPASGLISNLFIYFIQEGVGFLGRQGFYIPLEDCI